MIETQGISCSICISISEAFHLEAESENIKIETSIERNKIGDYSIHDHDHCSIQLVCKNVNHIKPGTCHFT